MPGRVRGDEANGLRNASSASRRSERHVVEGEQRIVRQREVLRELERDAHPDAAARGRELLAKFEETLALHIADRDRLRKQFEMLQQSQQ